MPSSPENLSYGTLPPTKWKRHYGRGKPLHRESRSARMANGSPSRLPIKRKSGTQPMQSLLQNCRLFFALNSAQTEVELLFEAIGNLLCMKLAPGQNLCASACLASVPMLFPRISPYLPPQRAQRIQRIALPF